MAAFCVNKPSPPRAQVMSRCWPTKALHPRLKAATAHNAYCSGATPVRPSPTGVGRFRYLLVCLQGAHCHVYTHLTLARGLPPLLSGGTHNLASRNLFYEGPQTCWAVAARLYNTWRTWRSKRNAVKQHYLGLRGIRCDRDFRSNSDGSAAFALAVHWLVGRFQKGCRSWLSPPLAGMHGLAPRGQVKSINCVQRDDAFGKTPEKAASPLEQSRRIATHGMCPTHAARGAAAKS